MFTYLSFNFFFQAEDGIRDLIVTGVQTCALPIFRKAEQGWQGRYVPAVLQRGPFLIGLPERQAEGEARREPMVHIDLDHPRVSTSEGRSEERRVGKECGSRRAACELRRLQVGAAG